VTPNDSPVTARTSSAESAPRAEETEQVRTLLRWFRRHRRALPWRRDRDPYRLWVAEVFLQQTRVEQAVPFYTRFLRRFPRLVDLARASPESILKSWEGAGYYARARHLGEAARVIVRDHHGKIPRDREALRELPGFGPYISAAVASLAFGERVPALEANGVRVLARWGLEREDPRRPAVRRRLERQLMRLLPRRNPGELNEAIMELGETLCLPRNPRCLRCPVARGCRARHELPDPGSLPRRGGRPLRPHHAASVVVIERSGRWLVQRRPPEGLLGGLWEFPGGKVRPGESPREAARREVFEETGARLGALSALGVIHHGYSHFTVELHAFRAPLAPRGPAVRLGPHRRWLTPSEFARRPCPEATRKVVELWAKARSGEACPD